jgi:hypothetical protein
MDNRMSGRIISAAESWETVYKAFQDINFTAFDYQSIKESLIAYVQLYFPETYNDYIESSEFIAILELFAYVGELITYRVDMNSQENFLPTAQRKQSILRLAKLISYKASRNIPARGLVKLTSISTTEPIYDSNGTNLSGTKINWNDTSNTNWKDQFLLVMDHILTQPFGSVLPDDRVQVQDVLFELYTLNNVPTPTGVFPYSVSVSGTSYPMELVSSSLNSDGPYEKRPEINIPNTLLYGSDGLGDGSSGTGFFFFTKQGTLQLVQNTFDGITPNQTFDINKTNINETDVWINNVDPVTLQTVTGNEIYTRNSVEGEWFPVDLAQAQNIIYNTNVIRNKYEIETLENDNVRIIFGDGEFAEIPSGLFHFWVRTSANENVVIPQSSINNVSTSFTYVDVNGIVRTCTFTFSATSTLQNAAQTEDIEHIRRMAPSVYYTQDRMVNGRDYNTFMLQDQTILKIRSFNRTFAGESNYVKYVDFVDPSGMYDNIKIFGDDLAVYLSDNILSLPPISPSLNADVVIRNYVEPLLSNPGLMLYRTMKGDGIDAKARTFTIDEFNLISSVDYSNSDGYLSYDLSSHSWILGSTNDWYIKIQKGADINSWLVSYKSATMVAESPTTKFWFNNENQVINYDSLNPGNDVLVLLKANENRDRTGTMLNNTNLIILDSVYVETGTGPTTDIGLPNINQFSVIYADNNGDLFPDFPSPTYVPLSDFINPTIQINGVLPFAALARDISPNLLGSDLLYDAGTVNNSGSSLTVNEYVYFTRASSDDYWTILPTNYQTVELFSTFDVVVDNGVYMDPLTFVEYTRKTGRNMLNFMWMHRTPNNQLVDPAAMNIIDTYIISRGYYTSIRRWLDGYLQSQPTAPTPFDLRTSYAYLIDNRMISDSMILHSGNFKILFGKHAPQNLQAVIKVIRSPHSTLTDNQIKLKIIGTVNTFFDISQWDFGETFYFTELAAAIHAALPVDIDSVVLVPLYSTNFFGDLFQVNAKQDELFIADVTVNDIELISSISRLTIKQGTN